MQFVDATALTLSSTARNIELDPIKSKIAIVFSSSFPQRVADAPFIPTAGWIESPRSLSVVLILPFLPCGVAFLSDANCSVDSEAPLFRFRGMADYLCYGHSGSAISHTNEHRSTRRQGQASPN